MQISAVFGILLSPILIAITVKYYAINFGTFWNGIALLFVCLGSAASAIVSFGTRRVYVLFMLYFNRFFGRHVDYAATIHEILSLARAKRTGYTNFVSARKNVKNIFLRECAELLDWGEAEVSRENLRSLLETRAKIFNQRYTHEAQVMKAVTRFPLMYGSICSLIILLAALMARKRAPALEQMLFLVGRSIIPIYYGMVISFIFLIPVYKNLEEASREDHTMREMVVEGVMMIHDSVQIKFLEEAILSFLLPHERGFKLSKQG